MVLSTIPGKKYHSLFSALLCELCDLCVRQSCLSSPAFPLRPLRPRRSRATGRETLLLFAAVSCCPILAIPRARHKIPEDRDPCPIFQLQREIEPGDWLPPPLLIYTPHINNVLHQHGPPFQSDDKRLSLLRGNLYSFRIVGRSRHGFAFQVTGYRFHVINLQRFMQILFLSR